MQTSFVFLSLFFISSTLMAQSNLVTDGSSKYKIVISKKADSLDKKAAGVLQEYIFEISTTRLPIATDDQIPEAYEICIGKTNRTPIKENFKYDGFIIKTIEKRLFIYGDADRSSLYGVYHFLDSYLGCRKFTPALKYIPKQSTITFKTIYDLQNPQFSFRQVYYPGQYDEEYKAWHKLNLLEEDWGLWGHSFDKLLPAKQYFKTHPEYFALVNGERKATQLCLSNPDVLNIVSEHLGREIKAHAEKKIWSVSQNDGFGYCTCDQCKAIDKKYGGPQGSVINFANKIATRYPDQTISTLAYLYSKHPPQNLKPAKNLSILLSSIDVNRAKPIETNPGSSSFVNDVKGWTAISQNVMIWDYVVQFTNYVSPFPNLNSIQANMNYFGKSGLNGAFIQGTENTFGEFAAYKTYALAKLSWEPKADLTQDLSDFLIHYYGKAAPFIKQYQEMLQTALLQSDRILDIYGDPTGEWNTWLKPENIDQYSTLLDQAEDVVQNDPDALKHVTAERLPLEYAVLQQSRFYGIEKHGVFTVDGNNWQVRPGLEAKVSRFIKAAQDAGAHVLKEDGLTIEEYGKEWQELFKNGPLLHLALGKTIEAITPFSSEYPSKGNHTLTDGTRGYHDFQYNYLGWYGNNLEVVIDLGKSMDITQVTAGFLEDQRHWAFLPLKIESLSSADGQHFESMGFISLPQAEEQYDKETRRFSIRSLTPVKARYIKLKAQNLTKLPEWRDMPNRKSWLFCDEIEVN